MLLPGKQRSKLDETEDRLFYEYPRFVTHVDEGFIDRLRGLYSDRLSVNSRVLDLMSSWVSHLPDDRKFSHVEGHGMNEEELARNRQLNHYFIQDLNKDPKLPLGDREFDAVLICVSVQYLQYPEAVFSEIHRVLKPGGVVIVSFSNRMFFQKAIAAWRDATEAQRVKLVESYFNSVRSGELPGFSVPEVIIHQSSIPPVLQMLGLGGGDPFYAVIAHRQI
ncbi:MULTISPECIES: class I SAM-dependent methyltransferase [Arthrospira]|jgi:SAM-dependent methyltransferase|uniref:Methyltransferase type 11 domain-containing protein n=1 Tax=Limnospira platensis NIES-46 TaxID=1236695 RepID=A0A5M3T2E6_LIMPL|nr:MULTISPECIES: class I SAM-dependent methyltransferase [Arthrospira]AMW30332.1 methyltransferase type 11 [Arthrospira platensis YZ]KDR55917.1 methyltransferase type 11 [Arthrospira platensis str. Paraca]MBD2671514.1 class I SAM-dependent methyltransferase [Arthrospira platensis FACHB-439]MBD2712445.1 class I SAM-dependent methyltransferase [Arthrospira platensis FACHB-835]MDF2207737.1 class I SAM-dependent methyltransferase [Arthrospira platensis NCB002]MDT9181385.1 class I SAM-dependent me